MIITRETAPHIRRKSSAWRMMLDVIIALTPIVIFSLVIYGLKALMILCISLFVMVIGEFVYVGLRNKMPNDGEKHTFKEKFLFAYKGHYQLVNVLAPIVSALIFAMILPVNATWYATLIGALAGIVLGKLVFGGLGNNIFNPAAVGMVIVKVCFENKFPAINYSSYSFIDVAAGGTPLTSIGKGLSTALQDPANSFFNLFFGKIGGTLGEACSLLIIIAAVYLLIRHAIDYRIVASYGLTFLGLILVSGLVIKAVNPNDINYLHYVALEIFSGGFLFALVFMITDPVTSPITSPSRVMYGMIAAIATIFIRFFAALPEGVCFSILIANMLSSVLDYYKWSTQRYTLKKMISIILLFVIPCVIMVICLIFKKDGFWYV